jgi:hypothetical protein
MPRWHRDRRTKLRNPSPWFFRVDTSSPSPSADYSKSTFNASGRGPALIDAMDGLSAASSIIAVIQITASLASLLKDYYTGIRDARADIQRLYYSMNSLRTVVTAIKQLNDRYEKSLVLAALLTDQDGPLQSVLLELKRIETKLGATPKDKPARVLRSLKWPFQKADVEKMVLAIDSNKATLALQFTIENL